MTDLGDAIDRLAAETTFTGVVRVDRGDETELARAYGLADRRCAQANTIDTQLGLASGGKALTALAVVTLIEDGVLTLDTTARSLLGSDLPLIDDAVTVEQLLAHRSGIGDYIDEDDPDGEITDYVLSGPIHRYATIEAFLPDLDGHPQKFAPGERFAYCNGGYVVLALLAERASGVEYHELVEQRVCYPAGMDDTEFLRSDELPGRAATGYLAPEGSGSDRSNLLHLPVLAPGDGGIYSTVADVHTFWNAFLGDQIVSDRWIAEMIRPRSDETGESKRYGLGFWLHATRGAVMLEGYDAGVSFKTVHDPATRITHTVISNWSEGAWPITRELDRFLDLE
jgi:CubicO group peptidase (beta-lactamase class C family)